MVKKAFIFNWLALGLLIANVTALSTPLNVFQLYDISKKKKLPGAIMPVVNLKRKLSFYR